MFVCFFSIHSIPFTSVYFVSPLPLDAASCFDFDFDACRERVLRLNPNMKIIPVSAKTGEGMEEWYDWIREQVRDWKEGDK